MSSGSDDEEKEHEPSRKRLDDARKRGEVPRSPDISTAAGYGGLLLAAVVFGGPAMKQIGNAGMVLLDQPDRIAALMRASAPTPVGGLLGKLAQAAAPFFLLPAAAVVLSLVAQRALTFTPEKLLPKLSRISPLATAKQKFGRNGLFEFAKSLVKLVLVSAILAVFLKGRLPAILGAMALSPGQGVAMLARLLVAFLFLILIISALMGLGDYLWQHYEHLRRNRMSRKELQDEMKDSEGDPHVRQQRRQRGQEIATNQMLAEVPGADVVIVNPTHYAVALKWDRASGRAPHCVAKGTDEIAARIREAAAGAGVPLHRDPPTARALHATVRLGAEIGPDHYPAVAAAIRFAEAMRRKARHRFW